MPIRIITFAVRTGCADLKPSYVRLHQRFSGMPAPLDMINIRHEDPVLGLFDSMRRP